MKPLPLAPVFCDLAAVAAALAVVAAAAPHQAVRYRPGAAAVRLYHRGVEVLIVARDGTLLLDAKGCCSEALRGCYNRALAALGRPESFRRMSLSGWCVRGGPNAGPCAWAVGTNGRLGIRHRWGPLAPAGVVLPAECP